MKNGIKLLLVLCILSLFAGADIRAEAAGAETFSFYEDGDVVGFIGDSVTHATYIPFAYPEILCQYYLSRFPGRNVEFRNLSAAGFKARDILDIYDRDPAFRGLDRAVILLGTNNAILKESAEEYIDEMGRLVDRLKADGLGGEDILVVSPPICDENYSKNFDRNGRKRWTYEGRVLEYLEALEANIPEWGVNYLDIHTPMVQLTEEIQAESSGNSLTTDCIHPNIRGQFLIAAWILEAQGAGVEAMSEISVQEENPPEAAGGTVTDYYRGDRGLCLTWTPETLPVAATGDLLKFLEFYEPARALYRAPLRAEGFEEESSYRVLMGETELGSFTGRQLVEGIDLAMSENHPLQETMRQIEDSERKRHKEAVSYRNFWVEVGMQRANPTQEEARAEYEKWQSADEQLRNDIRAMVLGAGNTPVRIRIVEEGYSVEELEQEAAREAEERAQREAEEARREAEERARREAEEARREAEERARREAEEARRQAKKQAGRRMRRTKKGLKKRYAGRRGGGTEGTCCDWSMTKIKLKK